MMSKEMSQRFIDTRKKEISFLFLTYTKELIGIQIKSEKLLFRHFFMHMNARIPSVFFYSRYAGWILIETLK